MPRLEEQTSLSLWSSQIYHPKDYWLLSCGGVPRVTSVGDVAVIEGAILGIGAVGYLYRATVQGGGGAVAGRGKAKKVALMTAGAIRARFQSPVQAQHSFRVSLMLYTPCSRSNAFAFVPALAHLGQK